MSLAERVREQNYFGRKRMQPGRDGFGVFAKKPRAFSMISITRESPLAAASNTTGVSIATSILSAVWAQRDKLIEICSATTRVKP